MRPEWYADKKDLVKWSVLITLAKKNNIKRVVYAVYLRESNWLPIQIDEKKSDLPREVLTHFRDIADIKRIENKDLNITIVDAPFKHKDRDEYTANLKRVIERINENIILFLDPDTGLEPPKSRATEEHIKKEELNDIWASLKKDSFVVLYQHAPQYKRSEWIPIKKQEFTDCLKISETDASVGSSFDIANNVIFLIAKK
jgi:hypothetical protein